MYSICAAWLFVWSVGNQSAAARGAEPIPNGSSTWGGYRSDRYVWLRMWGPGRVCIQSQYEHFEDSYGRAKPEQEQR